MPETKQPVCRQSHRDGRWLRSIWCCTLVFLLGPPAFAQESDTLWIEPVAGHKESKLGAQVETIEKVEQSKGEEFYKIKLSMPKTDSDIEEVVVIAKPNKPQVDNKPAQQTKNFEVFNPPDPNRSGIIIYLGKKQSFALRLNYEETRSELEPHLFPEE